MQVVFLAVLLLSALIVHAQTLVRGPYLQLQRPDSVLIRWRTDIPSTGGVRFGPIQDMLGGFVPDPIVTTEHAVLISGLFPDMKYFYQVGTMTGPVFGAPDDGSTFFYTSPLPGTVRPALIWAIGDAGTGQSQQYAVRDAYMRLLALGNAHTDVLLMLGDNAYASGQDAEYQANLFNVYAPLLRNTPVWPAVGNHDTAEANTASPTLPYFRSFTLPANGESGGVPSGTPQYYSFDYANIHFICLDSMTSDRSPSGAMAQWLRADLAANNQRWIIAYWHHSPYTKGSHDSDTELQLEEMRQTFNPILEAGGADVVLTGHSHSYERSFLIDGHYGSSNTLAPAMVKNASAGPYFKTGAIPHEGTIYAVAGTAGRTGTLTSPGHPAMVTSQTDPGSVIIYVVNNYLWLWFLTENGAIKDALWMQKGAPH